MGPSTEPRWTWTGPESRWGGGRGEERGRREGGGNGVGAEGHPGGVDEVGGGDHGDLELARHHLVRLHEEARAAVGPVDLRYERLHPAPFTFLGSL